MKLAVLLCGLFFVTGCTKLCDAGKSLSAVAATTVAGQLDCKNVSAVQADIEKQLAKVGVCDTKITIIGGIVCAPAVDALMGGVLKTLPSEWECSGGEVGNSLRDKLLEACNKVL